MKLDFQRQRILVTGGLGFIGHYLVENLVRRGAVVQVVDNCQSNVVGPDYFLGRADLALVPAQEYTPTQRFDWICHLASDVGPLRVMTTGGEVGERIVDNMKWLLHWGTTASRRVLYVSTSEVYGIPGRHREDDDLVVRTPFSGRREYATAKLLAEIMLENAKRKLKFSPLVIRPFNVVGPRQTAEGGFVIPRFIESVRRGEALTVYGDGMLERCFTHVADLVNAMVELMATGAAGTFNVGAEENRITIGKLAVRFREALLQICPELEVCIEHVDPRALHGPLYEEAPDKLPNIGELTRTIQWRPQRTIDDILAEAAAEALRETPVPLSQNQALA